MYIPDRTIEVVNTGNKLNQLWGELEMSLPNAEIWAAELRARRYVYLAARLGGKATGMVAIRWGGPTPSQPNFVKHVEAAYPGPKMPPAIYSLFVKGNEEGDGYRRQGFGRELMKSAEKKISKNTRVPNRVVLTVEGNNEAAINLYHDMGYEHVTVDGVDTVIVPAMRKNETDGSMIPVEVESIVMSKELRGSRSSL